MSDEVKTTEKKEAEVVPLKKEEEKTPEPPKIFQQEVFSKDIELQAMEIIQVVMSRLQPDARVRVLNFVFDRTVPKKA